LAQATRCRQGQRTLPKTSFTSNFETKRRYDVGIGDECPTDDAVSTSNCMMIGLRLCLLLLGGGVSALCCPISEDWLRVFPAAVLKQGVIINRPETIFRPDKTTLWCHNRYKSRLFTRTTLLVRSIAIDRMVRRTSGRCLLVWRSTLRPLEQHSPPTTRSHDFYVLERTTVQSPSGFATCLLSHVHQFAKHTSISHSAV